MVAALIQVRRWPEESRGRTVQGWCLDCEQQLTIVGAACPKCGSASWQPVQGAPLARRAA